MLSRVAKDNRVILESFSGTKEQVCHSVIELQWSKRKELGPWDLSRGGCGFRISKWEIHQNQHGLAKRPLFFDVFWIAFSWEWLPAIDGDIGRPVLESPPAFSLSSHVLAIAPACLSGGTLRARDSRSGWGISSINGGNLCCDCDSGETKHCHIAFPLFAVLNFAHKLGT